MSVVSQQKVEEVIPSVASMTAEQYISWIIAKDIPEGATDVQVVDDLYVPTDPLPSNPIPAVITMRQARLALYQSGLLSEVETIISGMPQDSQIEWEFAATVERSHPLVALLASELPLTEAELDDLFELGGSL